MTLFTIAFGTNTPTPLLLHYQADLGLSPTTLTSIFGVYAAGLLPALLFAGPVSDRCGRRLVAAPFVVVASLVSALFIPAASSVPLLYLCRFLQGSVAGVVFSVGSAWLVELSGSAAVGARRATTAMSAGWALGALSSGILAQWSPAPTTLPYVLHMALMGFGISALLLVPETLARPEPGARLVIGVPPGARRAFGQFVVPLALIVFTLPSVSFTVLPLFLQRVMVGFDVVVTGVVAAITLLAGVLVQPVGRRLSALRAGPTGVALGAAGLFVSLLASGIDVWALLLPSALLLGAGYGLCMVAGLTVIGWLATPTGRGALTAMFYALAYLGFGTPFLLSLTAARGGFAPPITVLAVLLALVAFHLARGPARHAVIEASPQAAPAASPAG